MIKTYAFSSCQALGKIIIPKDDEVKVEMPVEEKKQVKQELANFETKDVELLESIEDAEVILINFLH